MTWALLCMDRNAEDVVRVDELLVGRAEAKANGMDIHKVKNLLCIYRGSLSEAERWLQIAADARRELEKFAR